jgi:hypothetical protein
MPRRLSGHRQRHERVVRNVGSTAGRIGRDRNGDRAAGIPQAQLFAFQIRSAEAADAALMDEGIAGVFGHPDADASRDWRVLQRLGIPSRSSVGRLRQKARTAGPRLSRSCPTDTGNRSWVRKSPEAAGCSEDDNCYASETLNPRRLRAGLALRISVRGNRRWTYQAERADSGWSLRSRHAQGCRARSRGRPPEIAPSKSRLPDHRA